MALGVQEAERSPEALSRGRLSCLQQFNQPSSTVSTAFPFV